LEGVLDVTGPATSYTALLGPFVRRAAREIELRLFESARSGERELLARFHEYARRKRHAVVVLSPTVVLSNPIAVDLVSADDHIRLRALTEGLRSPNRIERPLTLSSGSEVVVQAQAISGTEGVLCEVVTQRSAPDRSTQNKLTRANTGASALVVGEPGTGRTRFATELGSQDARHVGCLDSLRGKAWLHDVLALLDDGSTRPVILDDVHMLDRRDAAALTAVLRKSTRRVIMTTSPIADSDLELAALASVAVERHELRPLRQYGAEFPDLVASILTDLLGGHSLRVAPSTMRTLISQPWPGNVAELRSVLEFSARDRRVGEIVVADLPDRVAAGGDARNLTPLELAERDAILKVLADSGGNKSAAAAKLGIGRTTLYQRLRYFKIQQS
jgi:transcriptional regulator of acetoin/glycerol metabolism